MAIITGTIYNDIGLSGTAGSDEIYGLAGNDSMFGNADIDYMYGGAGDDTMSGGSGADIMEGGSGEDSLNGGTGSDTLFGGTDDDYLSGGAHTDFLYGGDGNDRLFGGDSSDWLHGGFGDDELRAGLGNDIVEGNEGNDFLYGWEGDDNLRGGSGNDVLDGEYGNNLLDGGDGDDLLIGGAGRDEMDGDTGIDTARLTFYASYYQVIRRLDLEDAHGSGVSIYDFATGRTSQLDKRLIAVENVEFTYDLGVLVDITTFASVDMTIDGEIFLTAGNDNFVATMDSETTYGGDGDDDINASAGDDRLVGGAGDDILRGGSGSDTAVFSGASTDYALTGTVYNLRLQSAVESDRAYDMEFFEFSDGTFTVNESLELVSVNSAPTVAVDDLTRGIGEWTRLNSVLSVSDPDGDAMTLYQVWDDQGSDSWWADGGRVDASSGYTTSNLAGVWFQGDTANGTQPLWVRAFDGEAWSAWDRFDLTTGTSNTPPVATVEDQTKAVDQWTRLNAVLSASDADGDALTSYQIWDSAGDASWWADGGMVDASSGYTTSDLSGIWFQGDDAASQQTLWVRASDGTDWSTWDSFNLITF